MNIHYNLVFLRSIIELNFIHNKITITNINKVKDKFFVGPYIKIISEKFSPLANIIIYFSLFCNSSS